MMKKLKSTLVLLVLFSFGLLVSTIIDIMALHDVANDYVSKEVFTNQKIILPESLPDWSACSLEWTTIHFSIIFQLVLTLLLMVGLIRIVRNKNLG